MLPLPLPCHRPHSGQQRRLAAHLAACSQRQWLGGPGGAGGAHAAGHGAAKALATAGGPAGTGAPHPNSSRVSGGGTRGRGRWWRDAVLGRCAQGASVHGATPCCYLMACFPAQLPCSPRRVPCRAASATARHLRAAAVAASSAAAALRRCCCAPAAGSRRRSTSRRRAEP